MRKVIVFRTSGMATPGPFSWNAEPSLSGASLGHPSCPLPHCQIPAINTAGNDQPGTNS